MLQTIRKWLEDSAKGKQQKLKLKALDYIVVLIDARWQILF